MTSISLSLPNARLPALPSLARSIALRGKHSRSFILIVTLIFPAALGWFDFQVDDIEILWLVPIYLTTRALGRRAGIIAALGCAAVSVGADIYRGESTHSILIYWNATALLVVSCVVVILLDAKKRANLELEAKVEQRTIELDQVNVELKSVQFRLIEAGRMESVGRMAAGIAHEVKNPLMTITMAADYLAQVIPKDDVEAPIMVQDMRLAVDRANRVISELLEFSRPAELSLQLEDFRAIAEHALGLMKFPLQRKHIKVVRLFTEGAFVMPLDKNKMEQVLVNLFMNAIQAMPNNGTLTIATRLLKTGGLRVEIEDNGPGISNENLTKIEQPYFTTKTAGQGTGLGLAVCRNIMKLHGGTLVLGNRPEGGVRATIELNHQLQT